MKSALERIVYVSRAVANADSLLMQVDILAVSQRNNAERRLTGALAVYDGRFVQVLEGAPPDIDRLMATLEGDRRHTAIEVVSRRPIETRRFADWAMASIRITPDLAGLLTQVFDGRGDMTAILEEMSRAIPRQAA